MGNSHAIVSTVKHLIWMTTLPMTVQLLGNVPRIYTLNAYAC